MRHWLIGIGLLLGTTHLHGADEVKGPVWLTDYEQARQAARKSGKPLFVVFRCER